jgi:hypothetical protein
MPKGDNSRGVPGNKGGKGMASKENTAIRKKLTIEALKKTLGIVTPALDMVGVSRDTFYKWKRNDLEFKKAVEDIEEITLDFVESQLMKNIREGSEKAIMFFMRYKARKRGYSDEINMNIKMEQPLLTPLKEDDGGIDIPLLGNNFLDKDRDGLFEDDEDDDVD